MSGTEIILECGRPGCNETFNTGRSLWAAAAIEGREAGWNTDSNPEVCPAHNIPARLEYLRSQIQAECISYSELSELQALAGHIDAGDVELLEWAGVPEDAPIYGACGAEDCRECRPLFDADNRPIPGTEDAPFIKGGALESTNPPAPKPFPRDYKGWTIDAPNVHGLYTATNYSGGYGQVAADTLQGIKHIITQTMAEGPKQ
jgi:hypothetical protein